MYIGDLTFDQIGMYATQYVSFLGLCCARMFMLFLFFPPLSTEVVQGPVRNGVVLTLSIYVMMGQTVTLMQSMTGTALIYAVVKEISIGFVIGFVASKIFWIAESAGTLVDDIAGYNNAQMMNPFGAGQSTPVATLVTQISITTFWLVGGMTGLLSVVYQSYLWWPIGGAGMFDWHGLVDLAGGTFGDIMRSVAKLAAPMVFILALVDVSVGYVMAAAPKLDIGTISQSVKAALALLILVLALSIFISAIREQLQLLSLGDNVQSWVKGVGAHAASK